MSASYEPPTQDEIQRVGAYWQRVKALVCEHPEMVFDGVGEDPRCGDCGRPLRILSDIQIEEMRKT